MAKRTKNAKTKTKQIKREISSDILKQEKRFKKLSSEEKKKVENKQNLKELTKHTDIFTKKDFKTFKKKRDSSYAITMMFNNGTMRHFVLTTVDLLFIYSGKAYLLVVEESWFDISLNMNHFLFNEEGVVPINRELAYISDDEAETGKEEAHFSITPSNMKNYVRQQYVSSLSRGGEISNYLKINLMIGVVTILCQIVTMIIIWWGLFKR